MRNGRKKDFYLSSVRSRIYSWCALEVQISYRRHNRSSLRFLFTLSLLRAQQEACARRACPPLAPPSISDARAASACCCRRAPHRRRRAGQRAPQDSAPRTRVIPRASHTARVPAACALGICACAAHGRAAVRAASRAGVQRPAAPACAAVCRCSVTGAALGCYTQYIAALECVERCWQSKK
eukprot:IDg5197t1